MRITSSFEFNNHEANITDEPNLIKKRHNSQILITMSKNLPFTTYSKFHPALSLLFKKV